MKLDYILKEPYLDNVHALNGKLDEILVLRRYEHEILYNQFVAFSNLRFHISGRLLLSHIIHHSDVIMDAMASQITCLTIVYSTVYTGADQRIHQSSTSLAFVRGMPRWPVNSPYKWPITRKMFPFNYVIMKFYFQQLNPEHRDGKQKWYSPLGRIKIKMPYYQIGQIPLWR